MSIGELEVAGKRVIAIAEDAGQGVEDTYRRIEGAVESAANDVATGIEDTAKTVATGVTTATEETVTFAGNAVTEIESCIGDFLGCIGI